MIVLVLFLKLEGTILKLQWIFSFLDKNMLTLARFHESFLYISYFVNVFMPNYPLSKIHGSSLFWKEIRESGLVCSEFLRAPKGPARIELCLKDTPNKAYRRFFPCANSTCIY